ncbi:ABC transporter ATP-binding protein [Nonomuraea rubra]|uniref:Putative ABC transport system ATP-binding protein n=1 Tax=Nonomuraea rubra TaxID=46180 RepID=A0A7X0P5C6_9ACTN|nr:ABC transporter ATP-binding protein [Nonomuraea rubra]MBB6555588.1 putative ABC transport system ATP-binding protein [Nonomuraea rubra]
MNAVRLDHVTKVYGTGASAVTALEDVSHGFARGSFTAVTGPSGSGKSTLLQCAAGLVRPTSGAVSVGGDDLGALGEHELTTLRRERIGFVFQTYNLLPALTARENIELPPRLAGRAAERGWVAELIGRTGLAGHVDRRPHELSGGQQQRVAICRALVSRPDVVFADEPTGNLDSRSGREILALLRLVVDTLGQTVIMVTHDAQAASHADRVLVLGDGRVVEPAPRQGSPGVTSPAS